MKQGLDVQGIEIVVQYGVSRVDIATLWQRFGRGARGLREHAFVIILAESKFSDAVRMQTHEAAQKAAEKAAQKRAETGLADVKRRKKAGQDSLAFLERDKPDEYLQTKYNRAASNILLARPVARSACSGTHARAEIKRHTPMIRLNVISSSRTRYTLLLTRSSPTPALAHSTTQRLPHCCQHPSCTLAALSLLIGHVLSSSLHGLYHIRRPHITTSETSLGTRPCG
jgi:superfamily II DNA/RNA helicase